MRGPGGVPTFLEQNQPTGTKTQGNQLIPVERKEPMEFLFYLQAALLVISSRTLKRVPHLVGGAPLHETGQNIMCQKQF